MSRFLSSSGGTICEQETTALGSVPLPEEELAGGSVAWTDWAGFSCTGWGKEEVPQARALKVRARSARSIVTRDFPNMTYLIS
jgi:hypothetical protein